MKKLIAVIGILGTVITARTAPAINSDVYDYSWVGRTYNIQGGYCLDWSKWTEWYKVGVAPYAKAIRTYKYWNMPGCNNGVLTDDLYQWSDPAMTPPAARLTYSNSVLITTGTYYGDDYKPKRITEMAAYGNKTDVAGHKKERNAYGKTRFWINGVTNGLHHIKVQFIGGYWPDWWPGDYQPGDVGDPNIPALVSFDYVSDNVQIRGIQCNAAGYVTFYWNPYGGVTLDCTPTVGNATKNQHWWYELTMTIIP